MIYYGNPRYVGCVVVVVSHIQRIGCQPERTTLHGGQSRSSSAKQGKENIQSFKDKYYFPRSKTLYSTGRYFGAPKIYNLNQ